MNVILFYLLALSECSIQPFLKLSLQQFKQISPDQLNQYLSSGSLANFLSPQELNLLTERVITLYPQYFTQIEYGTTYLGQSIKCLKFTALQTSQVQIAVIGMMKGSSDLISVTIIMQQIYMIIWNLVNGDKYTQRILANKDIYFMPAVNLDAYAYIYNQYQITSILQPIDKNRNGNNILCSSYNIGVDISRNFIYQFGIDQVGSSGNQCATNYRGSAPLSEPETQTINQLIYQSGVDLLIVLSSQQSQTSFIIPNTNNTFYTQLLGSISKAYNIQLGTYAQFSLNLNGDICNNFLYMINLPCFIFNIQTSQQKVNQVLSSTQGLGIEILKQYSVQIVFQLVELQSCTDSIDICQEMTSSEKGYLVDLLVYNTGMYDFSGTIQFDIQLLQNGEQLYKVKCSYLTTNLSLRSETLSYPTKSQSGETTLYQYSLYKELPVGQYVYFRTLIVSNTGYFVPTVKTLNITFELMNALQNDMIVQTLNISSFKELSKYIKFSGLFPNRAESYVALLCFGAITFCYMVAWITKLIRDCFKQKTTIRIENHDPDVVEIHKKSQNGSIEQNHESPESRLTTEPVRFTQVAPSRRGLAEHSLVNSSIQLQ